MSTPRRSVPMSSARVQARAALSRGRRVPRTPTNVAGPAEQDTLFDQPTTTQPTPGPTAVQGGDPDGEVYAS
jgi:hypothetical protein